MSSHLRPSIPTDKAKRIADEIRMPDNPFIT